MFFIGWEIDPAIATTSFLLLVTDPVVFTVFVFLTVVAVDGKLCARDRCVVLLSVCESDRDLGLIACWLFAEHEEAHGVGDLFGKTLKCSVVLVLLAKGEPVFSFAKGVDQIQVAVSWCGFECLVCTASTASFVGADIVALFIANVVGVAE